MCGKRSALLRRAAVNLKARPTRNVSPEDGPRPFPQSQRCRRLVSFYVGVVKKNWKRQNLHRLRNSAATRNPQEGDSDLNANANPSLSRSRIRSHRVTHGSCIVPSTSSRWWLGRSKLDHRWQVRYEHTGDISIRQFWVHGTMLHVGRAAAAGTNASKSLYAAASEDTGQAIDSANSRPSFSLGDDDAKPSRKQKNRSGRTKELRSQVRLRLRLLTSCRSCCGRVNICETLCSG